MPTSFTDEEVKELGLTENLIRLSCGLEDISFLIQDVNQALNKLWVPVIFVNCWGRRRMWIKQSLFVKHYNMSLGRFNDLAESACRHAWWWFVCNSLPNSNSLSLFMALALSNLLITSCGCIKHLPARRELDKDLFGEIRRKRKKNVFACVLMARQQRELHRHTQHKWLRVINGDSFVSSMVPAPLSLSLVCFFFR